MTTVRSLHEPRGVHEGQARIARARELFEERWEAFENRGGSWFVPSGAVEGRRYEVRIGDNNCCECWDYGFRGGRCKHILAAYLYASKTTRCSGCGARVLWRFVTEVQEEHDLLAWFPGDRLCSDCIAGGMWA